MVRPEHEIGAYLEGQLTAEQARAIDAWVVSDPANAAELLQLVQTHQALQIHGQEQRLRREINEAEPNIADLVALDSLVQIDSVALTQADTGVAASLQSADEESDAHRQTDADLARVLDDLRWIAGKAINKIVRTRAFGITCIATAAVLTVTLFLLLQGSNQPDAPDIAESPRRSDVAKRSVATITATHNAKWQSVEGALSPGSLLYPNQRFTLTQGFAEITTRNGAVAILEAPCTFGTVDNPNALRLISGMLVATCETQSSKGFLVRTPHMDVIDLGTQFGVDATLRDKTLLHVFEGEVEAEAQRRTTPNTQAPRQRITTGQALAADGETGLSPAAYDPTAFVLDLGIERRRPRFAKGNAIWLGQLTGSLEQDKRQSQALQVFIERKGVLIDNPLTVDFDRSQPWDPHAKAEPHQVKAGERVDIYLLHFDLEKGHDLAEHFLIDFDRPILGVIANQKTLEASDAQLGVPSVIYPRFDAHDLTASRLTGPRGLNLSPSGHPNPSDAASVSAEGSQLKLQLWGGQSKIATMDQVRVIVQSAEEDNP